MMKLKQSPFLFLRHGETDCNARGVIAGATDSRLSDTGRRQAREARGRLENTRWSRVYCSALSRTLETAALAAPECDAVSRPGLNERDWGRLEGQPLSALVAYTATPPGGEPWNMFERRVTAALNDILDEADTPLVVGHSGVYRVICNHMLGRPDGPRIANAKPVLVQPMASGWQIIELAGAN